MKPISELVNDQVACKKIWDCIFPMTSYRQEITHIFIDVADNGKKMVKIKGDINGFETVIKLYFDGEICTYVEMPSIGPRPIIINPFHLVELLMGLGYAPEEHESIRSKSDNNGWIKINSEDDLPKEDGYCWVIDEEGDRWVTYYINDGRSFLLDQTEYGELNPLPLNPHHFTHYKLIPDPGKPLF